MTFLVEQKFKRMRYTIDFSKFKLGAPMLAAVVAAFKSGLKEMIPECDHPVYTCSPTLIIVEFDVAADKTPEHYAKQLWVAKKAYGLSGIDFKFDVLGEVD